MSVESDDLSQRSTSVRDRPLTHSPDVIAGVHSKTMGVPVGEMRRKLELQDQALQVLQTSTLFGHLVAA